MSDILKVSSKVQIKHNLSSALLKYLLLLGATRLSTAQGVAPHTAAEVQVRPVKNDLLHCFHIVFVYLLIVLDVANEAADPLSQWVGSCPVILKCLMSFTSIFWF